MAPGAADENMYVPENKSSTEGKQNGGVGGGGQVWSKRMFHCFFGINKVIISI